MTRMMDRLPPMVIGVAVAGLLLHGPIPQLPHYHDFADRRLLWGIGNGADVLSNAGFALVGLWGLYRLWPVRRAPGTVRGWPGYALFLASLVLTAFGSGYYHLDPDNARLVWDRLPIALACAGLMTGVFADTHPGFEAGRATVLLALGAALSVAWWYFTERAGHGDLRPYLLLQGLPLVLVPLWQAASGAPRADRVAFGLAIGLYVAAKAAELNDRAVLEALGWMSGHTLKHLLATVSSALIAGCWVRRARGAARPATGP
jgi:hypothetical protein